MMAPGDQPFRPRSDFLWHLAERGLFTSVPIWPHSIRGSAPEQSQPTNGFDLTADSLHVGPPHPDHDAALASADRPQADRVDGWRHEPHWRSRSFRDTTRPLLDDAQIEKNLSGIQRVFERFLQIWRWVTDPSR